MLTFFFLLKVFSSIATLLLFILFYVVMMYLITETIRYAIDSKKTLSSYKYPFRLEVIYRKSNMFTKNMKYKDFYPNQHFPPPGFKHNDVETKYDLILNPTGLKVWCLRFMLFGIASYIPFLLKYFPIGTSTNINTAIISFSAIALQIVLFTLLFIYYNLLFKRRPLFQKAWHGIEKSDFSLWFRKVPQKVSLHINDTEKLSWWGLKSNQLSPTPNRMPINILQDGSAQQSMMLVAMNEFFSQLSKSSKGAGITKDRKIFLIWLLPLIISLTIQFLILALIFILLPYTKGAVEFSAVLLIIPALVTLALSFSFLKWCWHFIAIRQDQHYDYLKFTPPTVQYFLNYDSYFYHKYKQMWILKTIGLVLTVIFSGIIFLIGILNEYNPPS